MRETLKVTFHFQFIKLQSLHPKHYFTNCRRRLLEVLRYLFSLVLVSPTHFKYLIRMMSPVKTVRRNTRSLLMELLRSAVTWINVKIVMVATLFNMASHSRLKASLEKSAILSSLSVFKLLTWILFNAYIYRKTHLIHRFDRLKNASRNMKMASWMWLNAKKVIALLSCLPEKTLVAMRI